MAIATKTATAPSINTPLPSQLITPGEFDQQANTGGTLEPVSYQRTYGPNMEAGEKAALQNVADQYVKDFFAVQPDDPAIDLLIAQIMDVGTAVMSATVVDTKLLQSSDAKDNAALISVSEYANTITELDSIYRKIDVRNKWWAGLLPEKTVVNQIIARHRKRENQINSISTKLERLIGQLGANNLLLHEGRRRVWELFGAMNQEIYKIKKVREAIESSIGPNGTLRSENPGLADAYYEKINPALSRKEADLEVHFKVLEANYIASGEEHRANEYRKQDGASLLTTNRLALETSAALKSARRDGEVYDKAATAAKNTADNLLMEMAVEGRKSAETAATNLRRTAVSADKLLACLDTMHETAKLTAARADESAKVLQETRDTLRRARGDIETMQGSAAA